MRGKGGNYEVLHVCRDRKFLQSVDHFTGGRFTNQVVISGGIPDAAVTVGDRPPIFVGSGPEGLAEVVGRANESDLVVLHGLDSFKAEAVSKIRDDVLIGWRFFGYEIYSRWPDGLYTRRTGALLARDRNRVAEALEATKSVIKRIAGRDHFRRALDRVDLFFGIFPDEYEHLVERTGRRLPRFIQFPVKADYWTGEPVVAGRKDLILIGNSRSPYNNHLDVLAELLTIPEAAAFRVVIPFNYGAERAYAGAVREVAQRHGNVELIESFQAREDYRKVFESARAGVYNGARQMALWNIFACMAHGVKLYLNPASPTYSWLRGAGALISNIDELSGDIRNGRVGLTQQEAFLNWTVMNRLATHPSKSDFQQALLREIATKYGRSGRAGANR